VAQDGTERIYRIFFQESSINDALKPTANDVFISRRGNQLFVASIRKDVTFIMYDQTGRRIYYGIVPDADPQAVDYYRRIDDSVETEKSRAILNYVDPNAFDAGLFIDVDPGQIYFYNFVESGRKKIKSGKIKIKETDY
jgi:hypothetical protein